jgi:MinD-like ATPase involved in chromosome partitioning or flagellar assembly
VLVEGARLAPDRVRALAARHPRTAFLATGPATSAALARWAEEATCVDLVERGNAADLRRALADLTARGAMGAGDASVLLGGKGGVGTTALAVNLAAAIAGRGQGAAVLDVVLYLGDVAWTAGVTPDPSLQWALARRRDAPLTGLARHDVGFAVLGPDPDLRSAAPVGADQIGTVIEDLCAAWRHVVVDAGASLTEGALAATTRAARVFVVTTEERAALEGARRRVEVLRPLLRCADALSIVLNRATGAVSPADVERFAGAPLAAVVRNGWAEVSGAIERHAPLVRSAPQAGVTADLEKLADLVAGPVGTPPPAPEAGWFRRLLGP